MPKSAQKGVVLGSYVTERSSLRILCTRQKLESNPLCKCQHIYHSPIVKFAGTNKNTFL